MHGEYKVPGGKLVVVDLEVADGRLSNVELSGDFFLHPEDALWGMTSALEGLTSTASEEEMAQRVRDAAGEAEMTGITPEGVAIAVHRALSGDVL